MIRLPKLIPLSLYCTLSSGHTIQAIENNKSYFLTIPNFNTLPNSDAGTKALTFNGVTTKAQSTDTIVTGSITINNSVEPEWNKTALANGASIKFTSTATSAPDVINLNNFIAYPGPVIISKSSLILISLSLEYYSLWWNILFS